MKDTRLKSFKECIDDACNACGKTLPGSTAAIMEMLLSEKTKDLIIHSGITDEELGWALTLSVKEIESGSLKTVDFLVRKKVLACMGFLSM